MHYYGYKTEGTNSMAKGKNAARVNRVLRAELEDSNRLISKRDAEIRELGRAIEQLHAEITPLKNNQTKAIKQAESDRSAAQQRLHENAEQRKRQNSQVCALIAKAIENSGSPAVAFSLDPMEWESLIEILGTDARELWTMVHQSASGFEWNRDQKRFAMSMQSVPTKEEEALAMANLSLKAKAKLGLGV